MAYTLGLDEVCIETCTRPTPCTTYMCEHADRRTYIDIHITYIQKCVHAWINTEQRTCRQTERDRETERHHRDRQTDGRTCETADLQTYVHTCMYNHANIQKGTHTHTQNGHAETQTPLSIFVSQLPPSEDEFSESAAGSPSLSFSLGLLAVRVAWISTRQRTAL